MFQHNSRLTHALVLLLHQTLPQDHTINAISLVSWTGHLSKPVAAPVLSPPSVMIAGAPGTAPAAAPPAAAGLSLAPPGGAAASPAAPSAPAAWVPPTPPSEAVYIRFRSGRIGDKPKKDGGGPVFKRGTRSAWSAECRVPCDMCHVLWRRTLVLPTQSPSADSPLLFNKSVHIVSMLPPLRPFHQRFLLNITYQVLNTPCYPTLSGQYTLARAPIKRDADGPEMKEGEGHSGHETLYTLPRTLADLLLSKGGAPPTPGTAPRGSLTFLIPTRCEVSTVQSGDTGSSAVLLLYTALDTEKCEVGG